MEVVVEVVAEVVVEVVKVVVEVVVEVVVGVLKSNSAGSEDVPCTSSETGRPVLGSLGAQSPSHQNYSTITIHLWLPQLICPSRLYSLSPTSCSLPGRHLAVNASVAYLQFTAATLFLSSAHLS